MFGRVQPNDAEKVLEAEIAVKCDNSIINVAEFTRLIIDCDLPMCLQKPDRHTNQLWGVDVLLAFVVLISVSRVQRPTPVSSCVSI
jgi:hypothetical protein